MKINDLKTNSELKLNWSPSKLNTSVPSQLNTSVPLTTKY